MISSTFKTLAVATMAASAFGLSACGGSTPSTTPAPASNAPVSNAPASNAPASSAPASDAPSTTESSSAPTTDGAAKDPCKVISVSKMSDLVGTKFASQKSTSAQGLTICAYIPSGATNPVTAIEGVVPGGGNLDDVFKGIAAQSSGGSPETVSVDGADEAKAVSVTAMGTSQYFVLATKSGVLYGSQVLGNSDASKAKSLAIKITETLIKA